MTDMAGVEDMTGIEDMTGMGDMTGIEVMTRIKGMKNDVRKERRASLHQRGVYLRISIRKL